MNCYISTKTTGVILNTYDKKIQSELDESLQSRTFSRRQNWRRVGTNFNLATFKVLRRFSGMKMLRKTGKSSEIKVQTEIDKAITYMLLNDYELDVIGNITGFTVAELKQRLDSYLGLRLQTFIAQVDDKEYKLDEDRIKWQRGQLKLSNSSFCILMQYEDNLERISEIEDEMLCCLIGRK